MLASNARVAGQQLQRPAVMQPKPGAVDAVSGGNTMFGGNLGGPTQPAVLPKPEAPQRTMFNSPTFTPGTGQPTLGTQNLIGNQVTPGGLQGHIGGNQWQRQNTGYDGMNPRNWTGGTATNQNTRGIRPENNWNYTRGQAGPALNPPRQTPDDIGDFDSFRDSAWNQAMRHLQPQMDQGESRFEQMMLARGIQPGSEQYEINRAMMDRRNNDILSQAAYGAQQQGLAAQNQFWNQGYQYDALANALNQSRIGADASIRNALTSANASMNNANTAANASMSNANTAAGSARHQAELAHQLGLNRLNQQDRHFDINDIFRNQQLDLQAGLGFGQLDIAQQGQNRSDFLANQSALNNWQNSIGAILGNAPGPTFQGANFMGNLSNNTNNAIRNAQLASNQQGNMWGNIFSQIPWGDFGGGG